MISFTFRPLTTWPRKKTESYHRRSSPFKATVDQTQKMLGRELNHLQAANPVVIQAAFSERHIRIDGLVYANAPQPEFPGIILTFTSGKHGPMNFCCDDCRRWQDNLRAIALTLERLRLADLYGVTKSGEQYAGWKALPGPIVTPAAMTVEDAARFVAKSADVPNQAGRIVDSADRFADYYRIAAKRLHPDANAGATPPEWYQLQRAKEILDKHFVSKGQ